MLRSRYEEAWTCCSPGNEKASCAGSKARGGPGGCWAVSGNGGGALSGRAENSTWLC